MSQDRELKKLFGKSGNTDFLRVWYSGSKKKIKNLWLANRDHLDQIAERDLVISDRDEAIKVLTGSQNELIRMIAIMQEKNLQLIKENQNLKILVDERGNLRRTA
ncbi:MAG: hypothetical protein L6Q54_11775 [Leptospiraceae bacterium]|nr:hypothetical protein [Leptospiraceae bacterium]